MKKVLLIGASEQTKALVEKTLSDVYEMYAGIFSLESVQGLVNVYNADLLIFSISENEKVDMKVFEWLSEERFYVPVLFLLENESFTVSMNNRHKRLLIPKEQDKILEECKLLLMENETEEENAIDGKKILIVDDSAIMLRLIKSIFQDRYNIILATSGRKALNLVKVEKPDLILLDYEMPEMDGKETFERLLQMEEGSDIPVIFLTKIDDRKKIIEVLVHKPAGYIVKPPDVNKLKNMVYEILG